MNKFYVVVMYSQLYYFKYFVVAYFNRLKKEKMYFEIDSEVDFEKD